MTPVAWHYLALLQELSGDLRKMQSDPCQTCLLPQGWKVMCWRALQGSQACLKLSDTWIFPGAEKVKHQKRVQRVIPSQCLYDPLCLCMSGLLSIFRWQRRGGGGYGRGKGEQVAISASGVGMRCNWCFHVFLLRVWGLNAHEVLIWNIWLRKKLHNYVHLFVEVIFHFSAFFVLTRHQCRWDQTGPCLQHHSTPFDSPPQNGCEFEFWVNLSQPKSIRIILGI